MRGKGRRRGREKGKEKGKGHTGTSSRVLNNWLSVCSKCPPVALTHARRCVHHCQTAVSIMHSQAVRIHKRSSMTSLIRPLAKLHAALSHSALVVGINFYAKNTIVTKFCHLALRGLVICLTMLNS